MMEYFNIYLLWCNFNILIYSAFLGAIASPDRITNVNSFPVPFYALCPILTWNKLVIVVIVLPAECQTKFIPEDPPHSEMFLIPPNAEI